MGATRSVFYLLGMLVASAASGVSLWLLLSENAGGALGAALAGVLTAEAFAFLAVIHAERSR